MSVEETKQMNDVKDSLTKTKQFTILEVIQKLERDNEELKKQLKEKQNALDNVCDKMHYEITVLNNEIKASKDKLLEIGKLLNF